MQQERTPLKVIVGSNSNLSGPADVGSLGYSSLPKVHTHVTGRHSAPRIIPNLIADTGIHLETIDQGLASALIGSDMQSTIELVRCSSRGGGELRELSLTVSFPGWRTSPLQD
ncbi:hypothetical protein DV736_g3072, partial [Chaetothyriales sp. CBS 134916]